METIQGLELLAGEWSPFEDGLGQSDDFDVALQERGWVEFTWLRAGDRVEGVAVPLRMDVWVRGNPVDSEFLMVFSGGDALDQYLKVQRLPDLMDVLSRWAPVFQTAERRS